MQPFVATCINVQPAFRRQTFEHAFVPAFEKDPVQPRR
jgi:hypothetical protein